MHRRKKEKEMGEKSENAFRIMWDELGITF